jgi:hypothetical protein
MVSKYLWTPQFYGDFMYVCMYVMYVFIDTQKKLVIAPRNGLSFSVFREMMVN